MRRSVNFVFFGNRGRAPSISSMATSLYVSSRPVARRAHSSRPLPPQLTLQPFHRSPQILHPRCAYVRAGQPGICAPESAAPGSAGCPSARAWSPSSAASRELSAFLHAPTPVVGRLHGRHRPARAQNRAQSVSESGLGDSPPTVNEPSARQQANPPGALRIGVAAVQASAAGWRLLEGLAPATAGLAPPLHGFRADNVKVSASRT